jgi:single-stranded DNA-binding protein
MNMKSWGYGNLVTDPKLEEINLENKKSYCAKFVLAVNEYIKNAPTEEKKNITHFFHFELFDSGAKAIAGMAKKGDTIMFSCTPRQYKWTNENDEKREKIVFRVDEFKILKRNEKSITD